MTDKERSAQFMDLNANERLLDIQSEIVEIEKKRISENLSEVDKESLKEKVKFLVEEERLILEARYKRQKDIKQVEKQALEPDEEKEEELQNKIKQTIEEKDRETSFDKKEEIKREIEDEMERKHKKSWYEKWWGKIIVIVTGAFIVYLIGL
jgi:hypothetical protein